MKNSAIGIFGREDDPEVDLLKRRIEDLGARAAVIDLCDFPKFTKGTLGRDAVIYDGTDLSTVDAFYLRQMGYFSPVPQREFTKEEWAGYFDKFNDVLAEEREGRSFAESLIQILSAIRPMVNPYEVAFYHKLKAYQYWTLADKGLPVPDFLAGNDFFELAKFAESCPSVVKPLVGGFVKRVGREDLEKQKESLRKRPVLLQREIKGAAVRSFVLGGRMIGTCETVYGEGGVDSRQDIVAMKRYQLPPEHVDIPVRACEALGMIFAGVDMLVEEKTGNLFVLECNPAPFFRNFEAQTGLPLSEELARYLVNEAAL